ncbi:MAG: 2-hydroxyacid dehydrogenase [SAR324 cluster bacterium]|nr:2-hydroxyacid dehydrogenase [SAR324 cluster bacterium]
MNEIILVKSAMILPETEANLEERYQVYKLRHTDFHGTFDSSSPSRARGVITQGWAPQSFIDALPNLEVIASFGVGYDGVDVNHATKRGVLVSNTPDILTEEVADFAIGLMLATARGLPAGDHYVREGHWLQGLMPLQHRFYSQRLGILGLGRIGKAIARRAEAFNMSIAYHGRTEQQGVAYRFEPNLVELARNSDFLIASCVGGESTHNLINKEVLEALGPSGILVNVARGSVVDELALITALQSGTILAAGLDVFADEPHVPEALIQLPNVVLQPHQASATKQTRLAMGQLMVDNLDAHFSGKPLLTPVNSFTK